MIRARVSVPATSANLGPGFDAIGLALGIRDIVEGTLTDEPGVRVTVRGSGEGSLPTDETHLIADVMIKTAQSLGRDITGLDLVCTNAIPQGRGMGSSAAAIIAGLVLTRELLKADLSDTELLQRANVIEGHADNISACLLGGLTVAAWEHLDDVRAVSLTVDPRIRAVVALPDTELSTHKARGLLPAEVPYADAVFNASRTSLLVAAMTAHPELLLDATADRLHQNYRRSAYPDSMALVDSLRAEGLAGFISGAGPSVMTLVTAADEQRAHQISTAGGFAPHTVNISSTGVSVL